MRCCREGASAPRSSRPSPTRQLPAQLPSPASPASPTPARLSAGRSRRAGPAPASHKTGPRHGWWGASAGGATCGGHRRTHRSRVGNEVVCPLGQRLHASLPGCTGDAYTCCSRSQREPECGSSATRRRKLAERRRSKLTSSVPAVQLVAHLQRRRGQPVGQPYGLWRATLTRRGPPGLLRSDGRAAGEAH